MMHPIPTTVIDTTGQQCADPVLHHMNIPTTTGYHLPQHPQEPQQPHRPNTTTNTTMPCATTTTSTTTSTTAANMADSIHHRVRDMLSKSRLVRNSQDIQLVRPCDLVDMGPVLGQGAFSQVSPVTTRDGRRLACKHLKADLLLRPDQFQTAATELAYEAHMLSALDHPHILKIRGWAHNGIASFEDGRHNSFFLLLDLLDETLDQRIERWTAMDTTTTYMERLQCLLEVASALDYMHEQGIIFRDLKPNNIGLLQGQTKVFDFGLSRELPTLDTRVAFEMSGKVGTLRYMAPEVVLHQPYNVSADVYSWAMVAYEVLTGIKPYEGCSPEMHTEYVCQRGLRPDMLMSTSNIIPKDLQVLLSHAWHADPSRRPSLKQIVAQLRLLQEQHVLVMEEQRLYQQQLALQQQQQQQPTPIPHHQEFCIDLNRSFFDQMTQHTHHHQHHHGRPTHAPMGKTTPRRVYSCESVGTIETESLSADSLGW